MEMLENFSLHLKKCSQTTNSSFCCIELHYYIYFLFEGVKCQNNKKNFGGWKKKSTTKEIL